MQGSFLKNVMSCACQALLSGLVFIFVLSQTACSSRESNSGMQLSDDTASHYLYLDINYRSNLMFCKYDISINLDGEPLGRVSNGDYFSDLLVLESGDHVIEFRNVEDSSVVCSKDITMTGDMLYSCTLKSHFSSISVSHVKKAGNVEGYALVMPKLDNELLDTAISRLVNSGFTVVGYEADDDSVIVNESGWVVSGQNIEPGSVIDRNSSVRLFCTSREKQKDKGYSGETVELDRAGVPAGEPGALRALTPGEDSDETGTEEVYEVYVWIGSNSRYYHDDGDCSGLKDRGLVPWEDAVADGYVPCPVCCGAQVTKEE